MIDLSIIVIFYNQKEYIKDSLGSIFSQYTKYSYEVICGDDGSDDGTYEELLEWRKKHNNLIVLRMERDDTNEYNHLSRASANRINCLKRAKGRYVAFLDGDDYYIDNGKIEKQISILDNDAELIACYHPDVFVFENGENMTEPCELPHAEITISSRDCWMFNSSHAMNYVFRNTYDLNKKSSDSSFDDNTIILNYLSDGKVKYIPDYMTAYRQHDNSAMHSFDEDQEYSVSIKLFEDSNIIKPEWKIFHIVKCWSAFEYCFCNRKSPDIFKGSIFPSLNEKFFIRTKQYKEMTYIERVIYLLDYLFMKMYVTILFKVHGISIWKMK